MPSILKYSRNRCTHVEQIDDETLRSSCRLQDTLTEAHVDILVKLPDLEIKDVMGRVDRTEVGVLGDHSQALKKVIGVRVGPSMLKIIKGLIGETDECTRQLTFMVEECCHAVILSLTKDVLVSSPRPKDIDEAIGFYHSMVKENIRLYNRCAAFAAGSRLVEGIEPPA